MIKKYLKENFVYLLFLSVVGLIGGFFTAIYAMEMTDPDMMAEALAQMGGKVGYTVISTLQVVSYALIFGILGKYFSKKIGLWRELRFEKSKTVESVLAGLIGGAAIMLLDVLVFSSGAEPEAMKESLLASLTPSSIIASFTYGGIIEEVMMRLFLMSLLALLLWKLFFIREETVPTFALVISNIVVAILFAASHLPATAVSIGLSPIIVLRCFVLNGSMGLVFGRAYRKHGIHYAMLAHIFAHVGMKLLGLLIAVLI
jgi:hypothetical protein